jgi:hypothetical protein
VSGSEPVVVTADSITFNVSNDDLDTGDGIVIGNSNKIAFNTTGTSDDTVDPTFTSVLNYSVSPVGTSQFVEQQTGQVLTVNAPTSDLSSDVTLAPGVVQQSAANVTVLDSTGTDTGGALSQGTNVTVTITEELTVADETGITHNITGVTSVGQQTAEVAVEPVSVTVTEPQSVVDEYDTDNDGIEIGELGAAGVDFASGELTIIELGEVGAAFASDS